MRVLHIDTERAWGGGEHQVLLLAQEQRRLGIDSRIACRRGTPLEKMSSAEGIPVVPLSSHTPHMLARLITVASAFDLFHCHTGRDHSLGALIASISRKALIVTRRVTFRQKRSWFNRFKYSRATKVICVSNAVASQLKASGLPIPHLEVIYDAVAGESCRSKTDCLEELGPLFPNHVRTKLIGNIASLVPAKDHALLLRAAQRVVSEQPDVGFVIIGDGILRGELLRLRKELRLEKQVVFTGFVPSAQRLIPAFDIFTLSSSEEGLGSIVLEAGLAGVPVVTTDAGGLPEIVIPEVTGLLCASGDHDAFATAVLRLLHDPLLSSRLALNSQRRVQNSFTIASVAANYQAVYLSTVPRIPTHPIAC